MPESQNAIGVLLITHGRLGQVLVDTVAAMLGDIGLPTEAIAVRCKDDPEERCAAARAAAARIDSGAGVLVLTDAFGSTPSNIANRLAAEGLEVVAGVNLPMLVRIYNYPQLSLPEMVASAVQAGRQGILPCAAAGVDE